MKKPVAFTSRTSTLRSRDKLFTCQQLCVEAVELAAMIRQAFLSILLYRISQTATEDARNGSIVREQASNLKRPHRGPFVEVAQALFCVHNEMSRFAVIVSMTYNYCHRCQDRRLLQSPVQPGTTQCTSAHAEFSFKVFVCATSVDSLLKYNTTRLSGSCNSDQLPTTVEEKGQYNITVWDSRNCTVAIRQGNSHPWLAAAVGLPSLVLFCAILAFVDGYVSLVNLQWRKGYKKSEIISRPVNGNDADQPHGEASPMTGIVKSVNPSRRSNALDALRGFALTGMVYAHNAGGGYWYLKHTFWNGPTIADLGFPTFIFTMGMSMALSMPTMRERGISRRRALLLKSFKRLVILFCLGLFLNKSADLAHYRVCGVLQRLGVTYFIVSLISLFLGPRNEPFKDTRLSAIWEIIGHWLEWLTVLAAVVVHTTITFCLRVPGCPTGYLGAGGISDYGKHNTTTQCTGGAAGYIDRLILTRGHMFPDPPVARIYLTGRAPIDPEGILSTLNCIFLCFLGAQAGYIMLARQEHCQRLVRWSIIAVSLGLLGGAMCEFQWNGENVLIPLNKQLWSLSFVLVCAALNYGVLVFMYLCIDIKHWWSGKPLTWMGMNSLLVYVGHELVIGWFPFNWEGPATHAHMTGESTCATICWILIAYYCHEVGFFLKA